MFIYMSSNEVGILSFYNIICLSFFTIKLNLVISCLD